MHHARRDAAETQTGSNATDNMQQPAMQHATTGNATCNNRQCNMQQPAMQHAKRTIRSRGAARVTGQR
jgi:hypothetical protein